MKLTRTVPLVIVLFMFITNIAAQELPKLKGKVVLANPRERVEIQIAVRDKDTSQLIGGEQPKTRAEDWFHVATLSALVDVEFDGGTCYVGASHSRIRVKQVNEDLPKLTLQKTRECKIKESRQQRSTASQSVNAIHPAHGGAASIEEKIEAKVKTTTENDELADDLMPSPEELKQELDAEAAHARNGEFFDTFQYKFALKLELYRNSPRLVSVLNAFRSRKENFVFFKAIGQVTPEMFNDVVRRELQSSNDVNLNNVLAVVKEQSASQSVRGTATVALLNGTLPDTVLTEAREYYREQSPESPIFANSLIALGRIGEAQDQTKLYSYITDGSTETRRTAMEALSLATIIEGPEAFPDGSKTLATVAANNEEDPVVRAFAFRSLRPFLYKGDSTAFRAVLKGSKDPNSLVRLQVVLALGVGQIEQNPTVNSRLRKLLLTDASLEVRKAARLALSGASTRDWFSPQLKTTEN